MLHETDRYSCGEIGNEGGGIFDFIVFGVDNIQLEVVDVFLELFSSSTVGGGKPVHGFLLDVGISESLFKITFKGSKSPEGLTGESLLSANFGPHGSGSFLHIRQDICNLPVIVIIEGSIDQQIEADRIKPRLGCLWFPIILFGATNTDLHDP